MGKSISIEYPDYLAEAMKVSVSDFEKEIKMLGMVKLFELGKISSGTAARVLEISRIEFLELLHNYKVTSLSYNEIPSDLENA